MLPFFFKYKYIAPIGVAQLVGHYPAKQRVTGLIPGQGNCLGCRFGAWSWCIETQLDDVSRDH